MLLRFSPLLSQDGPAVIPIRLADGGIEVVAQPIVAGQALSAAFPAGVEALANWVADAPAVIVSAVREVRVGGGAWSGGLGQAPVAGTAVLISVVVTDSLGRTLRFPEAGSATVVQAPVLAPPGAPQDGDAALIWIEVPPNVSAPGTPQDGDAQLVFISNTPGAPQDGDAAIIWSAA